MKNLILLCCFIMALGAFAQEKTADAKKKPAAEKAPTIAEVLDRNLSNLERDFTSAADAMPEDKWDFAPTNGEFKGVRTFREQVRHVAATNFVEAAGLLQQKPSVDPNQDNGPDNLKTKTEIMQFLKDSFALAHKGIATVTDKNVTEMITNPYNPDKKTPRLGMATILTWHSFDHYGQMVEYLRMNSIIPPASRPAPAK